MRFTTRNQQARGAFTLVELLVVIGIIAVLISILLPSLSRARQQANMVACLSNLRQIGQTLQLYTNDNKGFLPFGRGRIQPVGTPTRLWVHEITETLGSSVGTVNLDFGGITYAAGIAQVFSCPEAMIPSGDIDPNFKFHYAVNPRLMPDYNTLDYATGPTGRAAVRRQLATVRDGASKMLIWDGGQVTGFNNSAHTVSTNLDGTNWNAGGHCFTDPATNGANLDSVLAIGQNIGTDDATTKALNIQNNMDNASTSPVNNIMRFRHLGNRSMGALFCDGHAEQREINNVTRKEVCVNFQ